MAVEILYLLLVLTLIILSVLDIKYREVPDWLNYGLIFAALGLRLIHSVLHSDWLFFVYGILGLAVFTGFSYLFYYLGQWGGGDAKTFMAIGAVIGINWNDFSFPIIFLICSIFAGAVFGMIWSIALAIKNKKQFSRHFTFLSKKFKLRQFNFITLSISIMVILILLFLKNFIWVMPFFILSFLILLSLNTWIFIKAVEESCMMKLVDINKLTEGDWLVKDIKINGKIIVAKSKVGLEIRELKKLIDLKKKHKLSKVLLKQGIPFEPAFLIGFLLSLLAGNAISAYFLL